MRYDDSGLAGQPGSGAENRGRGRRRGGGEPAAAVMDRDAAAGPYRPLTRREIALAVPAGSRRARGQHEFLTRLGEDPELAQLRADRLRNIAECARIWARFASWTDRTTRPTRSRICKLAGISVSTFKSARRWLEGHGYLGTVRPGWTPLLRAAALTGPDDPNCAAVYVLCVPRRRPRDTPPVPCEQLTRPLTPSRSEGGTSPARPREAKHVAVLRTGPGHKLSDEHVAAIARPFLRAGWTPADLRHAVGHDPAGGVHRFRLASVGSPAHWLAWRLSRWLTEPDVAWQAFRELGRWAYLPAPVPARSPAARAWDDITPVGQMYLARSRLKAAAARKPAAGPHPIAQALREQMGWAPAKGDKRAHPVDP